MKNKNIFCSRNGGATIRGKFYPHPRVSDILGGQIRRQANALHARNTRRSARRSAGRY